MVFCTTMKREIKRVATEKLSISLPLHLANWLREEAAAREGSVSEVLRGLLLPAMRADQEAEAKGKAQPAVVMTARRGHASEVPINRVRR